MRGVPLLVVGENALVGSQEIPRRLPALVERYSEDGGVDWPDTSASGRHSRRV
jgi:hypothetical protein